MRPNIFAKNCKLHKFALIPIVLFKNQFFRTCIIIKRTCISIFSKIGFVDQSKSCTQISLQKMASCINLQLPIVILKKSIILDMCHHKAYMYNNFQQNLVCRSIKTVHTNLFAKKIGGCTNLQLQIINLKKSIMSNMHHCITYMYINFQPNRVSRSVKAVHAYLFANNSKLHKFATTNSNFENIDYFRHASS